MSRAATSEPAYTLRSTQDALGVSRAVLKGLIEAGFVSPARGPRQEYRFSFQDIVLLRTAYELQAAEIPPRRIVAALKKLKAELPETAPLTGLRISAVGSDVVVSQRGQRFAAHSGQLLLDFEVAQQEGQVALLSRKPAVSAVQQRSAADWFAEGEQLEPTDRAAAEAAYREALAQDPDFANAYVNLGALLCDAGRCQDALTVFDLALARCPDEALLHFNRAIALEDLGQDEAALHSYEAAIRLMPDFADAHFNAARVCQDKLARPQQALRHFSAYRRLQKR
ncbi:tetratricopeptide repeat protein [Ideonella sp. BN130291]|uniref:tetratricopeptide repeat protein n=1 Tax=Ideonella sp. BN130291 TaxID=3112940 RepID=UPI002E25DD91|nr:tetratricopeptide repeat protein [Ideonella sp. BN130291]